VIVTDNLADFPPSALPASIIRQSLDDFLLDIFDLHPGQAVTAVRAIAGRTGKSGPRMTTSEIAAYLSTHARSARFCRGLACGQTPERKVFYRSFANVRRKIVLT
jgi:hypothetical protein